MEKKSRMHGSKVSSPKVKGNNLKKVKDVNGETSEQSNVKEVKGVNVEFGEHSKVDQLTKLVKYLANITANNTFTYIQNVVGLPFLVTSCLNPKNSTITTMTETKSILAALSSHYERLTKSAPIMRTGTLDNTNDLDNMNLVPKLFTNLDEDHNSNHYINNKAFPSF
ncbi:copper-translocating P-type ATPase [Sesbania bispinosa]|nr:copper-translocating P-type ATPase [Sesbania bispinosa]